MGVMWLLTGVLGSFSLVSADRRSGADEGAFSFAVIGDLPYTEWEEDQYLALIDEINARDDLAFTIHVGDFKSGTSRCTDALYQRRYDQFQQFLQPVVYVFGDNEWTDCDRLAAGSYDPVERLARLRTFFTAGPESLGQRPLRLTRQSQGAASASFPENVRWQYNGVVFVGLNIPGSHNNIRHQEEYSARNAANLAWLRESFALAGEQKSSGIVIVIHADPAFEQPAASPARKGYNGFLAVLEEQVKKAERQVVLIHGDTHRYRIDHPLVDSVSGGRLETFTRMETFGSPIVQWVRVTVEPRASRIFTFAPGEPELLSRRP